MHGSPGPVKPDEILVRLADIPFSIPVRKFKGSERSKLTPMIFADVAKGGLSVVRDGAPDDEMRRTAEIIVGAGRNKESEKAGLFALFVFEAARVREFIVPGTGRRGFCIYETPEDMSDPELARPYHADVIANLAAFEEVSGPAPKGDGLADPRKIDAREELFDLLSPCIVEVSDLRSGLLTDLKSTMAD